MRYAVIDCFGTIDSWWDSPSQALEHKNWLEREWNYHEVVITKDPQTIFNALKEEVNDKDTVMEFVEIIMRGA